MICSRCKKDKLPKEIVPKRHVCRVCYNKYKQEWRRNTSKGREYVKRSRKQFSKQNPNYSEEWWKRNKANRKRNDAQSIHRWQSNNPEKVKAHQLLNQAIKEGKIVKPLICGGCQRKKRIYGHHPDYSKPLEIIWLCGSCHKKEHIK